MKVALTKYEPHKPTHEVEDARNDILREAKDGLQGGEDAVEDAAEDFEEGGEEVGDAVYNGGHCLVVVGMADSGWGVGDCFRR